MGCVTWQVFTQDKDLEKDGIDSCGKTGLVLHWYYELYDTHINVKYLYDYLFWNCIYLSYGKAEISTAITPVI